MKSTGSESGTAFGVDGCKAGWFCISIEPSGAIGWFVFETLGDLAAMANDGDRIFVDIPIGLGDGPEERLCDREAMHRLGPGRRSSVFPAPVRAALDARDYSEAKRISLAARNQSLSIQSWSILPKIREADALLRGSARAQAIVREVHPEICFWALAGENPMRHRKKDRKGIDERIRVLQGVRPSADREFVRICNAVPRTKVGKDDILDAMAAALTAYGNPSDLRTLPESPPRDACGRPMEMVYLPGSALGK
ncbi:MAG: DUF429 domain-containing protein [Gammaproteobacteria bacterium]|nr:DUF429 domain-containing protein [Gammaproteobacteria bacterium]